MKLLFYLYMHELYALLRKRCKPAKEGKESFGSFLNQSNPIDKAKIEMKERNDVAMAYLTMPFDTNKAMNHVNKCKTPA